AGDQEERPRCAGEDQRLHRAPARIRVAEAGPAVLVAAEEVPRELAELLVPRLVEPKPMVDLRDLGIGRVLAGEAERRVAGGQQVEDQERDRDDARDHDDRPEEPSGYVEGHIGLLVRESGRGRDGAGRPSRRTIYCLTATDEYAGPSVNWS